MKELFKQMDLIVEMGKMQAERLQSGKLVIPEKTENIKELIKNKALELTYEEEDEIVKLEKEPDKVIIYDMIVLLLELLRRQNDGLGVNKKEPFPAGSDKGE